MGYSDFGRLKAPWWPFVNWFMGYVLELPIAQSTLALTAYYRPYWNVQNHMKYNDYLPDLNNETEEKNEDHKRRLMSVNSFVLWMWQDDDVVVPKISCWFGTEDADGKPIELMDTQLY